MDLRERGVTCLRQSSAEQVTVSNRDLFRMKTCMFRIFCMGFSSSLFWLLRAYEGETNGSTGYHGCRGNDLFEQKLSRDSLRRKSS